MLSIFMKGVAIIASLAVWDMTQFDNFVDQIIQTIDGIDEELERYDSINSHNQDTFDISMHDFTLIVLDIDNLYDKLIAVKYDENELSPAEKKEWAYFLTSYTSGSVRYMIKSMNDYLNLQHHGYVINLIIPILRNNEPEIAIRKIERLLYAYVRSELQTLALLIHSYEYLSEDAKKAKTNTDISRYDAEKRITLTQAVYHIKTVFLSMDKVVPLRQTPYSFIYNNFNEIKMLQNFVEVTGLQRGILIEASDFPANKNKCAYNCNHFQDPMDAPQCNYGPLCKSKLTKCAGKLMNCTETVAPLTFCVNHRLSRNILQYVRTYTEIYGTMKKQSTACAVKSIKKKEDKCGLCLCNCVDETRGFHARRIYMKETLSDVKNNKIITGMQFIEIDNVIQIRLQQGEIVSPDNIVEHTVEWMPISSVDYKTMEADDAFFELNLEQREINLDILNCSDGYVLTGIKFTIDENKRLLSWIRCHVFDGKKLILEEWTSYTPNHARPEILVSDTSTPFESSDMIFEIEMSVRSTPGSFIKFKTTQMDVDVMQTVIPVFDGSPNEADPIVPLSQFGFYYKSFEYHSGFIAIQLGTSNVYNYIKKIGVGQYIDLYEDDDH